MGRVRSPVGNYLRSLAPCGRPYGAKTGIAQQPYTTVDPVVIYLALGSNLGDRADNLRRALKALRSQLVVEAVSPCYETEPVYVLDQPRFYNLACRASTPLTPLDLLHSLKDLETTLGREPGPRFGPRMIDLDLLFYGDLIFESPELTIPHPRLHERPFVLVPLGDLAPDLVHPSLKLTITELRDRLGDVHSSIQRVENFKP